MDKRRWLKTYRQCKHKVATREVLPSNPKAHGNLMCGLSWPLAHRCMFKKCPLLIYDDAASSAPDLDAISVERIRTREEGEPVNEAAAIAPAEDL